MKTINDRIMSNNNIIWITTVRYILPDTGEIIHKCEVTAGYYRIIKKEQKSEIFYKNNKQYGYIEKTFFCERTNQGRQQQLF